ncbi:MAG: 4Fe-4S ferredoxin, partial [Pseudomonadota bacterium]
MNQHIQLASIDDARNAQAKEAVRQRISWPVNLTPANVTYHSRGHALLLGSERDTRQAARALQGRGLASLTLIFTTPNAAQADDARGDEKSSDDDLLAATEALTTQALTRAQAEKL